MNDWDLIDEGLIRAAGDLPAVSRRLRRHVLRAAKKAERRRLRRRMLLAASLLLPLMVLGGWYQGARSNLATEKSAARRAAGVSVPGAIVPTPTDAWGHVDASIEQRQKQSRAIRSSLY